MDRDRERQLILKDGTDGLSHSGVITIREAQGRLSTRFGLRRWWLCLRDDSGRLAQGRHFPCLLELVCGAVRLRAENGGPCRSGETLSPLRGGTLRGVTLTQGFGGSEAEDQAALLRRARALRHYQGRCVSAADVDQLLRAQLEVTFAAPLAPDMPVRLWLELQPQLGRNPPDGETPPPIALPAQLWDGGAWRDIPCTDGTCGLLQSGYVTLTPSGASSQLRLLVEGEPEGEPRISAVAANPITLEQRRTRSQCLDLEAPYPLPRHWVGRRILRFFLPQGGGWREEKTLSVRDGHVCGLPGGAGKTVRVVAAEPDFSSLHTLRELPAEEIRLEDDGILLGSLRLMVEEDGVWYDCPVCPPEEGRTLPRGCCWDSSRKALRFGDGRDFCVPRGGRLLVAGCACTLGAGGNGAYGPLERDGVSLLPIRPAWGGQDGEDGKSAFFRAAGEQELPVRAVSLSDYEALARRTPGLALGRVKAVSAARLGKPGAGVVVLAQPRSTDPLPSLTRWQGERLRVWLERFRLIGVPLEVRPPRYCPIEVRLRVRLTAPAAGRSLRAAAIQHTDGVTGPLDFGAELSYTALFSALSAVPGVAAVGALELNALSGGGRRTQEGGLKLDADTLPYLERFQLTEE